MRKDHANAGEWCQHSRNAATGKAGHNRKVRRRVNVLIRKELSECAGKFINK